MPKASCQANCKGFLLLEVLVALAILAAAVTLLVQLMSANARSIAASENMTHNLLKAELKLREVINREKLEEGEASEMTDDGYQFDLSATEAIQDRTENLAVKLLAIKLTMSWREGGKPRSVSLQTMRLVDK